MDRGDQVLERDLQPASELADEPGGNQRNGNKEAATEPEADSSPVAEDQSKYLQGWRLWALTLALYISLFLSTLETTIVSTSLVSITNALNGFILRDWIVTSYLLTYTGFLTIYAKLSDIFGKKTLLLLAIAIFTIFSGLCGAANGIVELIILRAFQGIGASGIFSIIMALAPTLISLNQYGKYMAIFSTLFIIANVLGPVLGGIISQHSDWRWVFLLNIPGGAVAFVLVAIFLPPSEASAPLPILKVLRSKIQRSNWLRVDILGMIFLLAASVLLVFALEQGGTRYPWKSAVVISTLVLAVVLSVAFAIWEVFLEKSTWRPEPVFPPSICKDRLSAAMLLATILNNHLKPKLGGIVSPKQAAAILESLSAINDLDSSQQAAVRSAFAEGYNLQNIFMTVMSALGLIASFFLWERHPRLAG
ncbi:hypothetical protein ACHAPT_008218 [Fusarium lateritium]